MDRAVLIAWLFRVVAGLAIVLAGLWLDSTPVIVGGVLLVVLSEVITVAQRIRDKLSSWRANS